MKELLTMYTGDQDCEEIIRASPLRSLSLYQIKEAIIKGEMLSNDKQPL